MAIYYLFLGAAFRAVFSLARRFSSASGSKSLSNCGTDDTAFLDSLATSSSRFSRPETRSSSAPRAVEHCGSCYPAQIDPAS